MPEEDNEFKHSTITQPASCCGCICHVCKHGHNSSLHKRHTQECLDEALETFFKNTLDRSSNVECLS